MKEKLLFTKRRSLVYSILRISMVIVITMLLSPVSSRAQTNASILPDSTKMTATASPKATYPKVVGYLSFILPLETLQDSKLSGNFNGTTKIGFPVGVNVLYSDKFGFSYEFTPTVTATGTSSKTSNLLFDPGTMFRFQNGFTIITRLAFETEGRYGFTPVFNQIYARTKDVNYFVALSLPARFGNGESASLGLNLQIGFIFN